METHSAPSPKIHGRTSWSTFDRPSRITIPAHANPFAKLVFSEMANQRVTYPEIEHRSGVLVSTLKSWRNEKMPGLATIEACLGALGWTLIAVPALDTLPADVREKLDEIGEHFRSDEEAFGAAISAAAQWPVYARRNLTRKHRQERAS